MPEIPLPPPMACEPDPLVVQALLDAKAALWRGDTEQALPRWTRYICLAASSTPHSAALLLEDALDRRLSQDDDDWRPCRSFDTWVDKHELDATDAERQAARLRWIDQLVVEFGGQP